MHAPQSRRVELGGRSFHYFDFGAEGRPPAIFLHGTGLNAAPWRPYAEALGGRLHVLALDQRGHGDSIGPFVDYAWSEFAGDLHGFIDALGLARPLCVGHSMGGAVIAIAEGMRPGTIGRAFLIDPILMSAEHYDSRVFPTLESDPMAARTLRRRAVWESREAILESYRSRPPFDRWREGQLRLYVEHGTELLEDGHARLKCTPEIEARTYFGGHQTDPWPLLPKVEAPVLVLQGTASDTYPLTRAREAAAAMPRGEFVEVPGATHFFPMEEPEALLRLILDFERRTADLKALTRS